jgi:hypothetical protein
MSKKVAKPITRGRPSTGSAMTAAERMRRLRKRRKAAGLKAVVAWVREQPQRVPTYSSHRLLEARSLAMHAVITRKIERDPTLWLEEWQEVLKQPWQHIAALITEPSENGARMRQSSPFAGILTHAERWRVYEAFRA